MDKKAVSFPKTIGKIAILFIASFIIINGGNFGIFTLFQSVYSMLHDVSPISENDLGQMILQNPLFLGVSSFANILFLAFLYFFVKKVDKQSMKQMIFTDPSNRNAAMFRYGVAIALITMIVFILFGTVTGMIKYASEESLQAVNGKFAAFLASGIFFSVVTGFYEEIFFRGYILNQLLKWNRKYALVISSIIFMLSEITNVIKPLDLLGLFLTGIFFGYLYMSTSSLFITAGIHSTLHFLLLNIVTLQKYDYGLPTLFTFNSQVTMDFASSTGVCTVFVNTVSIILLYLFNKRKAAGVSIAKVSA
ncbi:CPBP family intramembrane glutamic endopeptidase [Brevibacillus sp. SYSU BS000544]|uniref:CPBP family intramembrane glutamic endopeptidase n=1 Tax=Brevibacillus sp. SYSU BS000544 TaxID=3416443 RepID=UPI003CE48EA7